MQRIKLSRDGHFAQENCCFRLTAQTRNKAAWIDAHDLFVDQAGRPFALVDTTLSVYFMDAVTGSLYSFGECHSSAELKLRGLRRDKDAARKYLMNLRMDVVDA